MQNARNNRLSRRDLLKGAGAGVLGMGLVSLGLDASTVKAQGSPSAADAVAFFRFMVGDFEVTIIKDNTFQFDPNNFAANAEEGALIELFEENNLPTDPYNNTVNNMLINTGDALVLCDTGTGAKLVPTLRLLGIDPGDVTNVVLTHFHGDHIGGAVTDGAATYANASYHMGETEMGFLQDNADNENIGGALASLEPIMDRIELFPDEGELLPGVTAMATPGHTPGHTSLMVSSGDASLMNMVDAVLNHVANVQRPDWSPGFDTDPVLAAETRRALMDMAAADGTMVFGYHFPFPGIGYITAEGDGFMFTSSE